MASENDNFNLYLSPKPFPVTLYIRLSGLYPCVPEELLLRQHAKAYGVSDLAPASLVDSLFLANLAQFVPPESCGEAVHESVKKNKSMRRPAVPRENIRTEVLPTLLGKSIPNAIGIKSMFSFPRIGSKICCSCALREVRNPFPSEEDMHLLIGYESGAVVLQSLKHYGAQLDSLRNEEVKADLLGEGAVTRETEGGFSKTLWGTSRTPSGLELLGYHCSGKVLCITHDFNVGLGLSGGGDGALYLWDLQNRYGTEQRTIKIRSQLTRDSAVAQFSNAVRTRRLYSTVKGAHNGPLTAISMYTTFLITGGADKKVKIWLCNCGKNNDSPLYVCAQSFSMEGWIQSITASPIRGVQMDDVLVTDDSGAMIGLKACTDDMKAVFTRSTSATAKFSSSESKALESSNMKFCLTRIHSFFSEESLRVGPSRVHLKGEISNTMIKVIPILNSTLLLSVTFSPVVRIMDYAHLRVSAKVQHPSCTSTGARINAKAASSVYRKETERRVNVFKECHEPPQQASTTLEKGGDVLRTEPLRFIDAIYVAMYDLILLLDNRNTVFVYERSSNDVLATVSIAAINEDGKEKKARYFLPVGRFYNENTLLAERSSESLLHSPDAAVPFIVVTTLSIELFHLLPTKNTVIEVPAHKSSVIGLAYRRNEERDDSKLITVLDKAENEVRNLFVSISRDGVMICWGRGLHFLRMYDQKDTVRKESSIQKSLAILHSQKATNTEIPNSEVTAFMFSEKWGLAVTGHENGDLRYWNCDDELSDVTWVEGLHSNSISGLAEGYCMNNFSRGSGEEDLLLTVSYDGCLGIWRSPARRAAVPKDKIRLSDNELLCVAFSSTHGLYICGDSAGKIFCVSSKERAVLFTFPAEAKETNSLDWYLENKGSSSDYHLGSITSICLLDKDLFVSCDDEGAIFLWSCKESERKAKFLLDPEVWEEKHALELVLLSAVDSTKFLASARSGHVYYFDISMRTSPIGWYKHSCEVFSIVMRDARENRFEFLIGGVDGSITLLTSSYFQVI